MGVNWGRARLNIIMPVPLKKLKLLLPQPLEDIAINTKLYIIYSLYFTKESITGKEDYNNKVKSISIFIFTFLALQSNFIYIGQQFKVFIN